LPLLESFGLVDLALTFTLRVENLGALDSLGLCLQLHAAADLLWRLNILEFVSEHVNSPLDSGFVKRALNLNVKVVALFECAIEVEKSDLRAHARLGQERHGSDGVGYSVGSLVGISDFVVQDSVDLDFDVVFGDGGLGVDVEHVFLQVVHVGYLFKDWDFEAETGARLAGVATEALDDGDVPLFNHDKGHKHF
jgi:hypothetical protein